MARVEKSIEVNAPLSTVYNQWTQFEQFPRFMEGVSRVEQKDDTHLRWHANIGGKDLEWESEITEQLPDRRVAWRSTTGHRNAGTVDFHRISDSRTLVSVIMDYEPEGVVENVGAALGVFSRRVEGDLERFRDFIERRGRETGAWRGEVGAHAGGNPGAGRQQEVQAGGRNRGMSAPRTSRHFPALFGAWEDPLAHMRRMSHEMDILFERLMGLPPAGARSGRSADETWVPQVEVTHRGDEIVVHADLPGVKKEDVQVEIAEGRLIIQGERRSREETTEGGVHRSECSYGNFYREIPIPDEADMNAANATMRDGVLEIRLRAPQTRAARRLEIHDAGQAARGEQTGQTQARDDVDVQSGRMAM